MGYNRVKRMKKGLYFLLVIILCTIITSCTTTYEVTKTVSAEEDAINRWKGASKQEIIHNFGPPNSERSDGGDGTLLVYNMNRSDGETINRSSYIWFYLNSEDICTNLKSDYFWKKKTETVTEIDSGKIAGAVVIALLTPVLIILILGAVE